MSQTSEEVALGPKCKKCKAREKPFSNFTALKLDREDNRFDIMAFLILILGVVGVWMKWKCASWAALILSFANIANRKASDELSRIFSTIFVSGAAIYILYMRDPDPLTSTDGW